MKDNKLDKLVFLVMWNFCNNGIVQNRRAIGDNVNFFIFHMVAFRIKVKIFDFYALQLATLALCLLVCLSMLSSLGTSNFFFLLTLEKIAHYLLHLLWTLPKKLYGPSILKVSRTLVILFYLLSIELTSSFEVEVTTIISNTSKS